MRLPLKPPYLKSSSRPSPTSFRRGRMALDKRKKQHPANQEPREDADHRLAFVMTARNGGFADPAGTAAVPTDRVEMRNELEYFDPERWDGMS